MNENVDIENQSNDSLFIVAASSRLARSRADRMVVEGMSTERLLPKLNDPDDIEFVQRYEYDGRLHVWSIRESPSPILHWSRMRADDWTLFYNGGFFGAVAKVAATLESRSLASAVWGTSEADELRHLVVFKDVTHVWAAAWQLRDLLGDRFLGFRRLADTRVTPLRDQFGSISNFIVTQILPHTADEDTRKRRGRKPASLQ